MLGACITGIAADFCWLCGNCYNSFIVALALLTGLGTIQHMVVAGWRVVSEVWDEEMHL